MTVTAGLWVRQGDAWAVGVDGRVGLFPDTKGLRHLGELLRNPGVEIPALQLAVGAPVAGDDGVSSADGLAVAGLGDAGPALDEQAKRDYRRRLRDLEADIEEAERFHDGQRAVRLRAELEFIERELAAAVGLGGRDRREASAAERARLNVTRAIRTAIDRLARHDPELGGHLSRSVRTGSHCAYVPVARIEWSFEAAPASLLAGAAPAAAAATADVAGAPEPASRRAAPDLADPTGTPPAISTGTVTILFSDMVGSTAAASQRGPAAAEELRRSLFGVLRAAVSATGGTEVKNLGDGLMVAFGSVAAALQCAAATQQRLARRNRLEDTPLEVRIGIATGDAVAEGADWFGPPVVEAARLCSAAGPGQVLVTEAVRVLAPRDTDVPPLEPLPEPLVLKGLPEPVAAVEVRWADHRAAAVVPYPARLAAARTRRFVGRGLELGVIPDLTAAAARDGRQVLLVCGEPGIGKTTLVAEGAAAANAHGTPVVYGRCEEGLGIPFQPWAQALDHLVAHAPSALLERHADEHGGELTRLVPALGRRLPGLAPGEFSDSATQRHLLFEAVAGLTASLAEDDGLLVVLDDLHWGDVSTVLLLRHVLGAWDRAPLVAVVTYRDTELAADHPLAQLSADLRREPGVTRLHLTGLEEGDVSELLGPLEPASTGVAAEVRRRTGGNPLFVREVARHLRDSGENDRSVVPEAVGDVVLRRAERLGERGIEVLATAAAIGREFDIALLATVMAADQDDLADPLDEAVRAALLREVDEAPGSFAFPHALIEQSLYGSLGGGRRSRLHHRIAMALEERHARDPATHAGELAHHWSRAAGPEAAACALRHARAAGARALSQLAADEAVIWYRRALEMTERAGLDPADRCDLLVALGNAERRAGEPAYRETLLEAARIARELEDAERLVAAALANSRGFYSAPGQLDRERVDVIERALEAVGPQPTSPRARLLARLSDELEFSGDHERRRALSDEALEIARRLDEPGTLIDVVADRFISIWMPETLAERFANAREAVEASERLGDPSPRLLALRARTVAEIEVGELRDARIDAERCAALAQEVGNPVAIWLSIVYRATLHTIAGELELAERLVGEALESGGRAGQADAAFVYGAQLVHLRFEQGRLGEVQPLVEQAVAANPGMPAWLGTATAASAEAGLEQEARSLLDAGAGGGFDELPRDIVWSTGIALYALGAARVRHEPAAGRLYELLEPFAGQVVYNGANAWMTVDHHLGSLAAVRGDRSRAREHLERAAELEERMEAPIWLARTRVVLAGLLLAGSAREARTGRELADAARAEATALGAAGVARDAAAVLDAIPASAGSGA